jgi:hypothetical protein
VGVAEGKAEVDNIFWSVNFLLELNEAKIQELERKGLLPKGKG